MARGGGIPFTLPAFAGVTRKLILANLGVYFCAALLGAVAGQPARMVLGLLALEPAALLRGDVWQPLTYSFLPMGILGTLFAMITLWFIGAYLEGVKGSRWLLEFYLVSAAGGGVLACLLTLTRLFGLRPDLVTLGASAPLLALLVAFGLIAGEQQIRFNFVLGMKAKYLVWIYLLFTVAVLLKGNDRFGALTELAAALVAYGYVKFAPARGLEYGATEGYFGARNEYYRWKRRRAARKFEVYMGKQGRKVHFDKDGRYVDPDEARRTGRDGGGGKDADGRRDPDDKRWMN